MYLKIMDGGGGFRVHDVSACRFERRGSASFVVFQLKPPASQDPREEELRDRAYIMNERGDTVETLNPRVPPTGRDCRRQGIP